MTDRDKIQLGKSPWNITDRLRGAMNADDFRITSRGLSRPTSIEPRRSDIRAGWR